MNLPERLAAAAGALAVGPALARSFHRIAGPDALDFLHRMATQDLAGLRPGESAYAAFLSPRGHLLGEGHVAVREADLLLQLDPAAAPGTLEHLEKLVIMDDVTFEDVSATLRALPVFGPEAAARVAGIDGVAARVPTSRRGAPCVEAWLEPSAADLVRSALVAAGAVPLGDEDLEVLRVLAGIPRFGADMDGSHLPMEAGLTREAISFTKGCYVGQETVMRATARGRLQRGLVLLSLPPGAGPGAPLEVAGQGVGAVTSAVDGPEGRLGLGYVRRAQWIPGTRLGTVGGEAVVQRPIVWEPEG